MLSIFRSKGISLSFLFLLCLAVPSAWAQTSAASGAVTGVVKDQTGAVVPNATVILTAQSGANTQKITGNDGSFTFPLLPPGTYSLSVEAPGFGKVTLNDIKVDVTQTTSTPITLQVGQTSSTVAVTAEATQVNTANSTLGNVLPGVTIESMPLATRNFTNLLALNANASSTLPNASVAGRGSSTVFVDGQRGTNNNLVINGVDANNLGNNNFGAVPIPCS